MDELLWSKDETPCETEYNRILEINRKNTNPVDIQKLLEQLTPVCRFDSSKPKIYRDTDTLKKILKENHCIWSLDKIE